MSALFPVTNGSAVRDLASDDPSRRDRSLDVIARAYWKPIYKYIRLRWRTDTELTRDLVQAFFAHALHRDVLASHDPARGRFRTFLRTILDRYVIDQHRRESTARKGGKNLAVDFAAAEVEVSKQLTTDPAQAFDTEWIRHVMQLALERLDETLRAGNKSLHADIFRELHLGDSQPTYAEVAARHGISVSNVTNWLHAARKQFRQTALEILAELTLDETDFAAEAMAVFGIDVREPVR